MTGPVSNSVLADSAAGSDGYGMSSASPSFWDQLTPASFRGVPFVVQSGQSRFGRRVAVFEYPFRDKPWAEDLGRRARSVHVVGYLVGDDVIAQRRRLLDECEKPGAGELVHPTLGRLMVSLLELATAEHTERGRVIEVNFAFVEAGERLFPGTQVSNEDAIAAGADTTRAAASETFARKMAPAAAIGSVVPGVSNAAERWRDAAATATNSATTLYSMTAGVTGEFGRLLGQASGIRFDAAPGGGFSLQELIGAGAAARVAVAQVSARIRDAALVIDGRSFGVFATLGADLAAAVRSACFTPAEGLRALTTLTVVPVDSGPTHQVTADYLRTVAVCEVAQASAAYQPSTYEEAAEVRGQVLAVIDAEMTLAGDQGDDEVYAALRVLRAEVIRDMNAKGAQLPTLVTVTMPAPMPALVLAQRLYRDGGRADELVRRANPVHPAFMPLTFKALSE